MGLLSAIIWIFIGIFYVTYKALKEEREETLDYIKGLAVLIFPLLFSILIFQSGREVTLSSTLLTYGFAGVIYVIEFLVWKYVINNESYIFKSINEEIEDLEEKLKNSRKRNLMKKLTDAGYRVSYKIRDVYTVKLLNQIYSKDSYITADEAYCTLSKKITEEICNLNVSQLCEILGVSCESIPQNDNINSGAVRDAQFRNIREQTEQKKLKYALSAQAGIPITTLDISKEKIRQQRTALAKIVLDELGLKFVEHAVGYSEEGYFLPNREYLNCIGEIVHGNSTKLNSLFVDYETACEQRESELNSVDDNELGKLLEVRLENIPLNTNLDDKLSVIQRRSLLIKYILEEEGLELTESGDNNSWITKANRSDNQTYANHFSQYLIDNNIKVLSLQKTHELKRLKLCELERMLGVPLEDVITQTELKTYECFKNIKSRTVKLFLIEYFLEQEGLTSGEVDAWTTVYTSFKKCVLGYIREMELSSMAESDFDKVLGAPLSNLPLDSQLTEAQRKALAVKYILEQEGAELAIYGDNAKSIEKIVDRLYPRFKQSVGAMLTNKSQP